MEHSKIIIVGGGLSGLGCAKRLSENGVDFELITEDSFINGQYIANLILKSSKV